ECVIETVRIEVRASPYAIDALRLPSPRPSLRLPATVRAWFDGWRDVPLVTSTDLGRGGDVAGPALIVEPHSTLVVEPGWRARRLEGGDWLLDRESRSLPIAAPPRAAAREADPARIEIFDNLFLHVAEQMGEVLRQTAQSVNIKERLDYSCALFDADGGLVANAPHMPVHLGSMGASVRAVMAAHAARMHPGDAWLINSPYAGGTHLPDMTVVTPVFLTSAREPEFYVATRAHHADIGGTSPGSMPAFSRLIEEEGTLFEDFQLVDGGVFREKELRRAFSTARFPARKPDQNVADLRGQLAANARGIAELERAAERHGLDTLRTYMRHVQANAAECVRTAISRLKPGRFQVEMDGGQIIAARIDIDAAARRARIDFSGTSAQGAHNFNAPRAVCTAAVLYVFRTLVERPIPLNEGCIEPLEIVIPAGSMLDPSPPAAVAAGNVETSQCIVDALYGALGVLAASQGTMNNLTFGDERVQYYETIAGGSGAGPDFDGADAVQTHMTNSRLTDPEILEAAFPVLVREFSIRRGSGGAGRRRGGNGVIRRLEFRAPVVGALLANRRRTVAFGLDGGASGAPGRGRIVRVSGAIEEIGATASFALSAGDILEIETPGGGGFGEPR
ncbi:MAG: hydantoinase B/oxoprolinase family protein, partial [Steroidobacteraceae bacterium]